MKIQRKKWLVVLLIALLLAGIGWRIFQSQKTKQQQAQASAEQAAAALTVELTDNDLYTVQNVTLAQGIAVSGTLKAVNLALVKARVPGELTGLTVREGDRVHKGQVIAGVIPTEYQARQNQARLQAEAARAQVEIAQRQYNNNKALVEQGFISQTALDTSAATLSGAQASYQAARAALDVANVSLADTLLKAPISGWISQRLAQNGERVGVDARIVEIVDVSQMELEATLSPADALLVRVGQVAQLSLEGSETTIAARVVRISPSAQVGSRNVLVYLRVESGSAATSNLRHGSFVEGTLDTQKVQALAVPLGSIQTDKPEPYVQLLKEGRVVHQTVKTAQRGEVANVMMVAIEGVNEGAVVLKPQAGVLRDGTLIKRVTPPTATKALPAQ